MSDEIVLFALVDGPNRWWITLSRPAMVTFFQPRHHTAVQRLTTDMIAEWMEEALQEWMDRPSWICFRGRDALERKSKVFFQLYRKQQRSILLWVMGLAVGKFRLCSEATKAHLETVQLNVRVGPRSFIDRYLWGTFDLDVAADLIETAISFSNARSPIIIH